VLPRVPWGAASPVEGWCGDLWSGRAGTASHPGQPGQNGQPRRSAGLAVPAFPRQPTAVAPVRYGKRPRPAPATPICSRSHSSTCATHPRCPREPMTNGASREKAPLDTHPRARIGWLTSPIHGVPWAPHLVPAGSFGLRRLVGHGNAEHPHPVERRQQRCVHDVPLPAWRVAGAVLRHRLSSTQARPRPNPSRAPAGA
jgi:hypothetical protein